MDKNTIRELFIAQFNQMWEWRRFHIQINWQIPVMLGALAGLIASIAPGFRGQWRYAAAFLLFLYFGGVVGLFLRLNAYQSAVGYVITHLERNGPQRNPLPRNDQELAEFCKENGYMVGYFGEGSFLLEMPTAVVSWSMIAISFLIFVLIVIFNRTVPG